MLKIGDLVSCDSPSNAIGLVVGIKTNVHSVITKRSICNVLIGEEIYPFRSDMLEVISSV